MTDCTPVDLIFNSVRLGFERKESVISGAEMISFESKDEIECAWTVADFRDAFDRCMNQGWIHVVDQKAAQERDAYIDENALAVPIHDPPRVGDIDFTLEGANVYLESMRRRSIDWFDWEFQNTLRTREGFYLFSLTEALRKRRELEDRGEVITACRVEHDVLLYWWRVQPTMYYLESEWVDRSESDLGGDAIAPSESVHFGSLGDDWGGSLDDADPQDRNIKGQGGSGEAEECEMLTESLARHGVRDAEWLLFAAIASSCDVLDADAVEVALGVLRSRFAYLAPITEEQCRDALQGCLSKEWLYIQTRNPARRLDLYGSEKGLGPPLHRLPTFHQLDVTLEGAKVFDAVATGAFGVDWAFDECVYVTKYKKVQYFYGNKEPATKGAWLTRHRSGIVSVAGPKHIGKWAAKWWMQFPEGYMVEAVFCDRPD